MSSAIIRLALCSRDLKLRPLLAPALGRDFSVVWESDCDKLEQMVRGGDLDVLLLDLDSESSNIEEQVRFFEHLSTFDVAAVVLTDDAARPTAIDLVQRGAYSYCRKPPALRELKTMLRRAYEHATMKRELDGRKRTAARPADDETLRCDGLIGSSAEMRNTYDMIRRVADLNASVLITGESGTGKELIARAIHNLGARASAPFIAVYCGAIPETLIESELFGHEKGAFTGTTGTRIGYLEQAANGTLLIDEIGELTLQTQVKLLRVLQQREFTRLGSGRTIPLKARVVFATHRNLEQMVADATFRLDLFYRINVVRIKSPALADHPEDIPALCEHFLKEYSELYQKRVVGIAPETLALLQEYDWPGNVRELENVIQSSIVHVDNEIIETQHLPERFQQCSLLAECDLPQVGSFERMLRDFKFRVASKAIEDCNGNKTLAARSLQISRSYLHRLVRLQDEPEQIDAA